MYRKNFNWTQADQKYYETYQVGPKSAEPTLIELDVIVRENLCDADYKEFRYHLDWSHPDAVRRSYEMEVERIRIARENVTAAIEGEATVTEANGYSAEQEQQVEEQASVVISRAYGKVRASRTGNPFPVIHLDPDLQGLFPNAYSERRELEQARAFFA